MTLDEYQKIAQTFAIYPDKGKTLYYPTLGLAGEAGEVADKIKKIIRDKGGKISAEDAMDIILELGDILWYIADITEELGFPLSSVAMHNIAKLSSRRQRNTLHGSGDNR